MKSDEQIDDFGTFSSEKFRVERDERSLENEKNSF